MEEKECINKVHFIVERIYTLPCVYIQSAR